MEKSRIKSIEGMRGLGIFMVLFNHILVLFYPAYFWDDAVIHAHGIERIFGASPLSFIVNGNSGVMIFLLITGAGTYYLCKKCELDAIKLQNFYVRHFIKFVFASMLAAFSIWLLKSINLLYIFGAEKVSGSKWLGETDIIYNYNFLEIFRGDYFYNVARYYGPLWPIKWLLCGSYFIILFLSVWKVEKDRRWMVYAFSIVALYVLNFYYLIPVLLGCMVADNFTNKAIIANKNTKLINIILLFLGIYFSGVPTEMAKNGVYSCLGFLSFRVETYHIVGTLALFYLSYNSKMAKKVFESKPFQFVGKYSMEVYFLHFAFLCSLAPLIFLFFLNRGLNYNICFVISIITTILILLLASVGVKKLVGKIGKIIYKK